MATVISKLSAVVGLNASGLTTGLANAQRSVDTFTTRANTSFATLAANSSRAITSMVMSMGKMAVAIAGAVGAWKSFKTALQEATYLDQVSKTAQSLGVNVSALIGLQQAAELAGVSNEELNKALFRQQRLLSENRTLMGILPSSSEMYNGTANPIFSSDAIKAMQSIASVIKTIEDPAERIRVSMELYGREGAKMLPLLSAGFFGLAKAIEEGASRYGYLTIEQTKAVEDMNDQWTMLVNTIRGRVAQLVAWLAPYIAQALFHIRENTRKAIEYIYLWYQYIMHRANYGWEQMLRYMFGNVLPNTLDYGLRLITLFADAAIATFRSIPAAMMLNTAQAMVATAKISKFANLVSMAEMMKAVTKPGQVYTSDYMQNRVDDYRSKIDNFKWNQYKSSDITSIDPGISDSIETITDTIEEVVRGASPTYGLDLSHPSAATGSPQTIDLARGAAIAAGSAQSQMLRDYNFRGRKEKPASEEEQKKIGLTIKEQLEYIRKLATTTTTFLRI